MRKVRSFLLSIAHIVVFCISLAGCVSSPPDVATVEAHFQDNYEDIQIVVDFMVNTEYRTIDIDTADRTMLADLERVEIANVAVNGAVERLLGESIWDNKQYDYIYKSGNTIIFPQWDGAQDIGCGIAYSINETDHPRIQYCTELVPLSQTGWYYYVDDYNTWRIENN